MASSKIKKKYDKYVKGTIEGDEDKMLVPEILVVKYVKEYEKYVEEEWHESLQKSLRITNIKKNPKQKALAIQKLKQEEIVSLKDTKFDKLIKLIQAEEGVSYKVAKAILIASKDMYQEFHKVESYVIDGSGKLLKNDSPQKRTLAQQRARKAKRKEAKDKENGDA